MTKPLSTFERMMKSPSFKKDYKKSYQEFLFSELLTAIMEADDKSVRALAKEAVLSPSVIQGIRSGKQHDIKLSNLIRIATAFGFEVILQRGDEKLALHDVTVKGNKHRIRVGESIY